ncbi:ABC transporter substrate-binding protein [Vibrio campbellii]
MINKKLSVVSAAIAGALFSSAAIAEKQIILDVAAFANYDQVVRLMAPEFEAKYPHIKINLKSLSFQDHHTALTTALSTGANVPDVAALEVGYIGRMANAGGLENLNQSPYEAAEFAEQFSPFTVPLGRDTKGQQVAIPVDIGPGTIFYRSDVLESAGVSAEDMLKDWDSFIEAGKQLKQEQDSYLVDNASTVMKILLRSGLTDGESLYFGPDNEILVEDERFQEAFRIAKEVFDNGLSAEVSQWSTEWNEGLRRGDIATQMFGSWFVGHIRDFISPDTDYWRTNHLPGETYASWGGTFLSIPAQAENKEEAWKFIKFMSDRVETQVAAMEFGTFPSSIAAQQAPQMNEPVEILGNQEARLIWRESAERIAAINAHRHDPVAERIIDDAFSKVINHNQAIDKALADASRQIQRRARR